MFSEQANVFCLGTVEFSFSETIIVTRDCVLLNAKYSCTLSRKCHKLSCIFKAMIRTSENKLPRTLGLHACNPSSHLFNIQFVCCRFARVKCQAILTFQILVNSLTACLLFLNKLLSIYFVLSGAQHFEGSTGCQYC